MKGARTRVATGRKIAWQGTLIAIQPHIRLTRYLHQRSRVYLTKFVTILPAGRVEPQITDVRLLNAILLAYWTTVRGRSS